MRPLRNLPLILLACSCQSQVLETGLLDHPMGVSAPAQDWLVDIEFGQQRIQGRSRGGNFLMFRVGDRDAAPAVYGGETEIGGSALFGDSRLDQLKSAAIQDAIEQAGCDVMAYPMFRYEEVSHPFGAHYAVTVTGFPGWVQGIRKVDRQVTPGVNRFPGSLTPLPGGAHWEVEFEGEGGALAPPPANVPMVLPESAGAALQPASQASGKFDW